MSGRRTTGRKSWLLVVTEDGFAKRLPVKDVPRQRNRGGQGVKVSSTPVAEAVVVDDPRATLVIMSAKGQLLRTTVGQVPVRRREVRSGQLSKGARLLRLESGDWVASASVVQTPTQTAGDGLRGPAVEEVPEA